MGVIALAVSNPIYIFPWGNAHSVVLEACGIMQAGLRDRGVHATVLTNQGVPVFSGNHVNARGWWDGRRIFLHSGKVPNRPGYDQPFPKGAPVIATVLLHEWAHSQGLKDRYGGGGLMDSIGGSWPNAAEIRWLQSKLGVYTKPKSEVDTLKAERQQLWYERGRINKRIKEIDARLAELL